MSGPVTERGTVIVARRAVGFGAGEPERFLVVQSSELNDTLPTIVVAPLDEVHPRSAGDPFAIRLVPREAGGRAAVAPVDLVESVPRDPFQPLAVGAASEETMTRVDAAPRVLLELA